MADPDTTKAVLDEIFAGGTALAGLILVFLGSVIASFESYDKPSQRSVLKKYNRRAWMALVGFVASLSAAALALAAHWITCHAMLYGSLSALTLAFLATSAAAVTAVRDLR